MKNICYLCKTEIIDSNKSDEHIIPKALGGRLISNKILCNTCNSKLGTEIDAKFISTFEPLICTLGLVGRDPEKAINCTINLNNQIIDGFIKNDKIIPKNPFFTRENKDVIFYGTNKMFSNFKKKIEIEAKKNNLEFSELNITIIDDLQGFFNVNFNIDNDNFNESLTKIALNYAYHNNLPSELLEKYVDTKSKKIISANSMSYIPLTKFEEVLEKTRSSIDSDFPNHTLILFTEQIANNKKMLVCYIDLFSTFQFYVFLSEEYTGDDLFIPYFQRIIKEEGFNYTVDENSLNHKSILPDIYEFEKRQPDFDLSRFQPSQVKRILETYLSQPRPYSDDYESNLRNMYDLIFMPLLCCIKEDSKLEKFARPEVLDKLKEFSFEFIKKAVFELYRFYYICTEEEADIVLEKNVRRIIVEKGNSKSVFFELVPSYLEKKENREKVKRYKHMKFFELMNFVNLKFVEKKEKLNEIDSTP